jgi:hypothetical protein
LGGWLGRQYAKDCRGSSPYVECATIFAHRDEAGLRFAKEAARLIAAMGFEVHLKGRG